MDAPSKGEPSPRLGDGRRLDRSLRFCRSQFIGVGLRLAKQELACLAQAAERFVRIEEWDGAYTRQRRAGASLPKRAARLVLR